MAGVRQQSASVGDVFKQSLQTGAIVGAAAYVVGYLVTFLLTMIDGLESAGEFAAWKAVGWVFYGAHNVQLSSTQTAAGQSRSQSYNIFDMAGNEFASAGAGLTSTIPSFVYMLVPVVVLIGAGYVAYQQAGVRGLETDRVAAVGASVVAGYLALAVVGRFLFQYSESASIGGRSVSVTIGPELATAVLLTGLLYPLVLGAIGAVLAQNREQNQSAGRTGV
jgi:hypothetical protein